MHVSPHRVAVVAGMLLLAACGDEAPRTSPKAEPTGTWRAVSEQDLDAAQRSQKDRALAARKAMFDGLFQALSVEVQRGGPAGAIKACKELAPTIAKATAKAHGVRIGRTSFKLRNPRNDGPDWVAPLVADRPDSPRFSVGPRGALGAVLPIRVQSTCLQCHGPDEVLREDVRTRLREEYPDDRATGFREGDLRGWFWVEVPGSS